jgi:glycosyltransferase involved in cell wall biosynthesis
MGRNSCTLDDFRHCADCFTPAIKALGLNDIFQTIDDWRRRWSQFLCSVDHLIVFSNFTKSRFAQGYPEHEHKVIVSSIPVHYLRKAVIKKPSNDVRIAVLGNINYVKGSAILREMLDLIKTDKTIKLFLFGKTNDLAVREGIINKGEYRREDLPELMEQNRISIIFIPSICGETFCRTAQEAIAMDIPLAVFDIGAPPERVRLYKKGLVISKIDAAYALSQMVEFVKTLPED